MNFNQIKLILYAGYITNLYGFRLKNRSLTNEDRKKIRVEFATKMLNKLNINIIIENPKNIPSDGKYMLISNHRSVIDPIIVEIALQDSDIYGVWVAKKELYNSIFFGSFTRNAGTILLDRESKQMGGFFADVKEAVKEEKSIFIFPEGTRNKSDEVLGEFKNGSKIIALKNRLKILPVYIDSNASQVMKDATKNNSIKRDIVIKIGAIIDPKDKSMGLEERYREQFGL